MAKNRSLVLALALGIGFAAAPAQAEKARKESEKAEKKEEQTMSFGLQALKDRFEAAAPEVGKRVPNVPVYTASGEKVRFRDLVRGHYSVVVFGCLT